MQQGKVKWFNDKKGYGFIASDDGQEYFVHFSGIGGDGFKTLSEGDSVEFELEDSDKGKRAVRVSIT